MAPTRSRKLLFRLTAALAVLVAVAGIVEAPLLSFYRISGNSMLPSYTDGDRVLVTSVGPVEVGDAVICRFAGETLIKRVVACPGDVLALRDGRIVRNGELRDELVPPPFRDGTSVAERELGEDEYYILGDNRRVSIDSRTFGPVHREDIVGRVIYRWFDVEAGTPVTAAEWAAPDEDG